MPCGLPSVPANSQVYLGVRFKFLIAGSNGQVLVFILLVLAIPSFFSYILDIIIFPGSPPPPALIVLSWPSPLIRVCSLGLILGPFLLWHTVVPLVISTAVIGILVCGLLILLDFFRCLEVELLGKGDKHFYDFLKGLPNLQCS